MIHKSMNTYTDYNVCLSVDSLLLLMGLSSMRRSYFEDIRLRMRLKFLLQKRGRFCAFPKEPVVYQIEILEMYSFE